MSACQSAFTISALACAIAKDKSSDELSLLGARLTQLGDTLQTMAIEMEVCNKDE